MQRPIAFVATTDAEAATSFYGGVIGLTLVDASPYALVFDDHGVMLRVQIVSELTPSAHTVHGWQVAEIEHRVRELTAKGVVFERFANLDQDVLGVWTTPDGNKIAWFKDPSANILSLTQFTD